MSASIVSNRMLASFLQVRSQKRGGFTLCLLLLASKDRWPMYAVLSLEKYEAFLKQNFTLISLVCVSLFCLRKTYLPSSRQLLDTPLNDHSTFRLVVTW